MREGKWLLVARLIFPYLFTRSGSIESLAKSIEKQFREASPLSSVKITPRDVVRAMALAKSIEVEDSSGGGGVGLKEILARIRDGTLGTKYICDSI